MNKKTYLGIGIFLVVIVGLYWWQQQWQQAGLLRNKNSTPAGFVLDTSTIDLGVMRVDEERTGEFRFKNVSDAPITIGNFETSCNCTFGRVITSRIESPIFNMRMHMPPQDYNWRVDIQPGEEAIIQVIYKPAIMPVFGRVERSLFFKTTDPGMPEVELKVYAFVRQ